MWTPVAADGQYAVGDYSRDFDGGVGSTVDFADRPAELGVQPRRDVGVGKDVAHDEFIRVVLGLRGAGGEHQVGADRELARGEHVDDCARLAPSQRLAAGVGEPDMYNV